MNKQTKIKKINKHKRRIQFGEDDMRYLKQLVRSYVRECMTDYMATGVRPFDDESENLEVLEDDTERETNKERVQKKRNEEEYRRKKNRADAIERGNTKFRKLANPFRLDEEQQKLAEDVYNTLLHSNAVGQTKRRHRPGCKYYKGE